MSRKPAMLQKVLTMSLSYRQQFLYPSARDSVGPTGAKASGELSVSGPVTINGTA
jgi:hypothetical protein